MGTGIFFPVCAIPFSILIIILFFKKGHVKNEDTRLFQLLILVNLIGLIIEILCTPASSMYDTYTFLSKFIYKSYLVYLIVWIGIFLSYVQSISTTETKEKNKKFKKFLRVLLILEIIITYSLDISLVGDFSSRHTVGLSVNFAYLISAIDVSIILFLILKNLNKIRNKKYLPILLFLIIGVGCVSIQFFNPSVLLMTYMETFICVLMYFTIENPDILMMQQLEIAKDAAEKANNAKSEFLSNMSHEIRTPLNAIVGFSQGLLEEDLPEESKNEVRDIIGASNSLLEIVNGILDISKIEANKLEIVNTEYNFEKIFNELVALSHGRLGDKPLDFRYTYDHSIPPVLYGDHVRVKQIVLNFLTNAIKYTREGYVSFTVSSVIKDDICRLIISVEDSGIGIKEENINKLFSKFERFDLEKNITIEGTGLGLAITKRLVELMNGKVVVQSKYGEGSKFTVAIDQRIVPKTLEEFSSESNKSEFDDIFVSPSSKLLVVDDNNINIKVATRLLKTFEIVPDTANSGQECINKILDGNKYDLILLDDMMPKMTGTETLQNLKKIMGFDIPVVALTANAITGMKEKYLAAGFDDYLSKPIDKTELEVLLRKYLKAEDLSKRVEEDTCNTVKENDNIVTEVDVESVKDHDINYLVRNGVDIDHSLELLGDIETINETFEAFLDESETRLPNIKNYKDINDMPNYAILVHAMKSDSKYLGMMTLADLAYNHEMASKANDSDYVNEHYDELMCEVNRMLEVIKTYLGR